MKNLILVIVTAILAVGVGAFIFNYFSRISMNNNVVGGGVKEVGGVDDEGVVSIPLNVVLSTDFGDINIKLLSDDAPNTVSGFVKLAKDGFYDGLTFHRVIPGFMIQGGDPYCGRFDKLTASKNGVPDAGMCGTGGPGYKFSDEIDANSSLYKMGYKKGIAAMANSGPNTNGSQFFIMVADYPLPPNYTIFGQVVSGQEVADKISKVARDSGDRPLEPVIIKDVMVAE